VSRDPLFLVAVAQRLFKLTTSGPVVPVADIRIIHPETREQLGPGRAGLLLVRGPQVMKRYEGNAGMSAVTATFP
jgi:long-subunit acyl-CoA synthetase (AMP-forming)